MRVSLVALCVFALRVAMAAAVLSISTSSRGDNSASFSIGNPVHLSVEADGIGPFSYQWKKNGRDIPGATASTLIFSHAEIGDSGSYTVSVTNAYGSTLSDVALIGIGSIAPSFAKQPIGQIVDAGAATVLSVAVDGSAGPTVQWQRNGIDIPGATNAVLRLAGVNPTAAGIYTAVVTNFIGSLTSAPAVVAVRVPNWLTNVSIRTLPGTGAQTLIVGFVTTGGAKTILARGVGPGLAEYTASPTYANPSLELYQSTSPSPVSTNDDWGGTDELRDTFERLGAFSLSKTSKDASIFATLDPAVYSIQLKGSGAGLVLAEIYDADNSDIASGHIVNLSARTQVGTGDGVLVAGFVIAGTGPKRLLIRAVGPTLTDFGVPGALAQPNLDLYAAGSTTAIKSNATWGGGSELKNAFTQTGAFGLNGASKDAAMLVTLSPGAYSAVVSGKNKTTGVALVEIYEIPE